ncbi:MAG TPA: prepilin-type N-terminal cleavage/methylation domain-containing protein [Phycisphaerae bacterium]|nr:prepilin-type N-terminal cleavage/methylation domain-containing protein [Phycisphaerae bacterium]HRR83920.1 prepilin-type N-terminal cleavage/methylation domain-containing protein [Phycisphaerae bacterium]
MRAFTLIEILVVVSIIALLISILLPSLRRAREQAQAVVCSSNTKQIITALMTYQLEAKGFIPQNLWSEYNWAPVAKKNLWFYKLYPRYLGDPNVYICPADPFRDRFDFEAIKQPGNIKRANTAVPSCGYGINYVFRHFHEPESFNVERYVKRPLNTILMAEVGPDHELKNVPLSGTMGQPWRDGGRLVWDDGSRSWYSGPTWLTTRHFGGINVASVAGAVQRVRTAEILRKIKEEGIRRKYPDCAMGDCYFCNYHSGSDATHYNFSAARLYWWVGRYPNYQ